MSYVSPSEIFLTSPIIGQQPSFDMKADFLDALSVGDIPRAASVFARDCVFLFPGIRPIKGQAIVQRMLGVIRRRYESIEWTSSGPMVCSDGWFITGWSVSGTFKDTGLHYENEVLSLIKLDEYGKIAVLSDYFKDTLAFQPFASEQKKPAHSATSAV